MDVPDLSVSFGLPPRELFQPPTQLPPIKQIHAIDRRFWNSAFYNYTLDVRFPFTVAVLYAAAVVSANRLNRKRANKPWALSKTKAFKFLVFVHNASLVWFNGWCLVSMCQKLWQARPSTEERNYFVHTVHRLCKPDGFREIDTAFSPDSSNLGGSGESSCSIHEQYFNFPNVDELWYLAWVFYLSKFYEVVDTAIILARGKQSSTLQTYHHAGVMICAWACVRLRAPPSLASFFLNSFIHTIMYSYYALSSIRIRVPERFKKSLTTMQMTQFVVGFLVAMVYCFIRYEAPIKHTDGCHHNRPDSFVTNSSVNSETGPVNDSNFGISQVYLANHSVSCLSAFEEICVIWIGASYVAPLFLMFAKFFSRTYNQTGKTKRKEL